MCQGVTLGAQENKSQWGADENWECSQWAGGMRRMQEGENGSVDLPEQMVGSQRGDGCQGLGGSAPCRHPRSPWDLPGPGELLEAWPSSWEQILAQPGPAFSDPAMDHGTGRSAV